MPTINLLKKRTVKDRQYKPQNDTPNQWARECYNTSRWRKLRESQLIENPLCEMHLMYDKVEPATCVHHINEVSNAGSRLEAMDMAFDGNNLMSLCEECHQKYHAITHSVHSISGEDLVFINKYKELCNKKSGNQ